MSSKALFSFTALLLVVGATIAAAGKGIPDGDATVDQVTVEVIMDGQTRFLVTVDEEHMGSAGLRDRGRAVAFRAEDVDLRGESVRLALYDLDDVKAANIAPGPWIEDLELRKGADLLAPPKLTQKMGSARFEFRLVDVKIAGR